MSDQKPAAASTGAELLIELLILAAICYALVWLHEEYPEEFASGLNVLKGQVLKWLHS